MNRSPARRRMAMTSAALGLLVALAAGPFGCSGEQIGVSSDGTSIAGPSRAAEPAASHSALTANAELDGTYVSDDGLVTGWYDRVSGEFSLRRDEVDHPEIAVREQAGTFVLDGDVATGAVYVDRVILADGTVRETDVELEERASSKLLRWDDAPEPGLLRSNDCEILPAADGLYGSHSPFTIDYVDENPETTVSPDGAGFYGVTFVDGFRRWTGRYTRTYDDGSTLDKTEAGWDVNSPIELDYVWNDAGTAQEPDEVGSLLVESDGRTTGTITRYDDRGVGSCVYVVIEGGAYSEYDCF